MKERISAIFFLIICCQFALIAGTAVNLGGCAARPHPGTANQFDSRVYDTLLTTHKVIEDTKAEVNANSFSADILVKVKAALNVLITVYNDADIFYCNPPAGAGPTDSCAASSYHAQAMAGQATASADAAMQAKLTELNDAVSTLAATKGSK